MNGISIILCLFTGFLNLGCTDVKNQMDVDMTCISGIIVGQKCDDFALQLDKKGALGATDWQKKTTKSNGENEYAEYNNVIGLLNLPKAFQREGLKVYVKLRVATKEESIVPCYLDMPNPPRPVYMLISADSVSCPLSEN